MLALRRTAALAARHRAAPAARWMSAISATEVEKAQEAWAAGIVAISGDYLAKKDYKATAAEVLDDLRVAVSLTRVEEARNRSALPRRASPSAGAPSTRVEEA